MRNLISSTGVICSNRLSSMQAACLVKDRERILGAMAGITLAAWVYLYWDAHTMNCARWMSAGTLWNLPGFLTMLTMWSIMMVAVPSAAPMVLTFALVNRRREERSTPYVPAAVFVLGYVIVWTAFSALATSAQFWLTSVQLLSMSMASASPEFAGVLLIAVDFFQWTPWKQRCLTHCASPLQFLMGRWREGWSGALRMGIHHGLFCLGCCWAVMSLLFVAGVMNLLWVAALSLFVLAEKVAPRFVARPGGAIMAAAGAWLLFR
jgi:predicted metal-binding membrane protein